MKWLNIFKKNKPSRISGLFPTHVKNAIKLIPGLEGDPSDELILELFRNEGMTEDEAIDILIFLPIAFVRHWLPDLEWHDHYYERKENGKDYHRKYRDNESFVIIEEITKDYYSNRPDNNTIVKIGGRSAELNALNQLLLDGSKLEDAVLSPNIIFR